MKIQGSAEEIRILKAQIALLRGEILEVVKEKRESVSAKEILAPELEVKEVKSEMSTSEILAQLIFSAGRNEEKDNRLTAKDLKRSEIPARRDSKRHSDRVEWRGMSGPSNLVKAIYQNVNEFNQAQVAKRGTQFTDSPENNGHCEGGMRAV